MNSRPYSAFLIPSCLALALAWATWSPLQSQAAEPTGKKMMTEQCQSMMEDKQKMAEEMKVQDDELTALVAKMNDAPEDKQMDLMAAVITQLVEQRTAMHARHAKMNDEMMTHAMQHMTMGKESMSQCPMMKGKDGNSAEARK